MSPDVLATAGVTIRAMRADDVAAAAAAARTALEEVYPEHVAPEDEPLLVAAGTARVAHVQDTDPGGCWVAEVEGPSSARRWG